MIAVIFTAEVINLDRQYHDLTSKVRLLADEYGCEEFISISENNREISISYWDSQDQIKLWKKDPMHLLAQKLGQEKYYKSYKVQVVDVLREYSHGNA